jgi:chromate reductase, NAD(P)H dehydrogenase (quinone)
MRDVLCGCTGCVEYNYLPSGVLKNAIDWASRPYGSNSWAGKPAGIISASVGILGGARAQYSLRQSFVFLGMPAMVGAPEIMVTSCASKFDDKTGELKDADTRKFLAAYIERLAAFTRAEIGKK